MFALWPVAASAARFGKYLLSGALEVEDKQDRETTGDNQNNLHSFAHRYKFDVQSFVLSPKLLNYNIGLTVEKGTTDSNGSPSDIDNLGYNLRSELFPGRRVSSSLYANRESTTTFTAQTASAASALVAQTNTNYGAVVNLNHRAFPMTINYDENRTEGSSGTQVIDRNVRRLQLSANKDVYGFKGNYGYAYTNTADVIEQSNNTVDHLATINLEKIFSDTKTFRQELRYSASSRQGRFQDIITPTVTKTADYTLTSFDEIVRFDATLRNLTATLPTAVGDAGRTFTIVKADASVNTVTIRPFGAETISGATSMILQNQFAEVTLVSNGLNWAVGSRSGQKTVTGNQEVVNLNSITNFSYRPSKNFSNDSSLSLYFFRVGDESGRNYALSNATNYQMDRDLDFATAVSGSFSESGTTSASTENITATLNYRRDVGRWNLGLTESAGLNFSSQSSGPLRRTGTGGIGATATRPLDWLKSTLTFQSQATKSASSEGGKTFSWQSSASWLALLTEMLEVQSNLRYSLEDSTNETILVAAATDGQRAAQPGGSVARTIGLDLIYTWQLLVTENKVATLNGGAVVNRQQSESVVSGYSTMERKFYYTQLLFKYAPLRSMLISSNLRGEWDSAVTETSDGATGNIALTTTPRTAYIFENTVSLRIRKIVMELQCNWREESGSTNPVSRQSIYLKVSRPF